MVIWKSIVLAGSFLLSSPNSIDNINNSNVDDVPGFKRNYVADTKIPFVKAEGPIIWMSRYNDSEAKQTTEFRGYLNVSVKIASIEQARLILGVITKKYDNSIESIIYTNNATEEKLSKHDWMIAKREHINMSDVTSLWTEKYDLLDSTITNLETGQKQEMGDAKEFQNLYFNIPKNQNLDTLINVHFKGHNYPINVKIRKGVESYIEADLTYPDPKNPSKRKELIDGIMNIRVYTDNQGLPYKIIASARLISDYIIIHPEAKYNSK
jgi:hypothetical protein